MHQNGLFRGGRNRPLFTEKRNLFRLDAWHVVFVDKHGVPLAIAVDHVIGNHYGQPVNPDLLFLIRILALIWADAQLDATSLRRAVTRSCPVRQLSSAGEALSSGELVRTTMFSFACLYMFMAHRAFPKFRPATSLATGVTVNRSCSKSSLNLHPSS